MYLQLKTLRQKVKKILFIADLDGTILGSNHCLIEPTKKAILNLQDMGILFSVATGRSFTCVEQCALPINCPGVFDNGGVICYPNSQVLSCFPFSMRERQKLRALIKQNRRSISYSFLSSGSSHRYTMLFLNEKKPETILNWFGISVGKIAQDEQGFLKELEQGTHRLSIVGDIKDIPLGLNYTTNNVSGTCFHEFTHRGVDKGRGINIMAKHLVIPSSQVIVAGNDVNDFSMFCQGFGTRIAVGPTCPEEITRLATHYVEDMATLPVVLRGLMAELRR